MIRTAKTQRVAAVLKRGSWRFARLYSTGPQKWGLDLLPNLFIQEPTPWTKILKAEREWGMRKPTHLTKSPIKNNRIQQLSGYQKSTRFLFLKLGSKKGGSSKTLPEVAKLWGLFFQISHWKRSLISPRIPTAVWWSFHTPSLAADRLGLTFLRQNIGQKSNHRFETG